MAATIVPIEKAEERFFEVSSSPKIEVWARLWGNKATGIPVLFVHGGPGNCVATYDDLNKDFFDPSIFYVIEVDQRGCGKSRPSVLDREKGFEHMQIFRDITIEKMSADFDAVRKALNIDKWLVFGGSWGSTLGLDYGLRYPERCLALIVRGIFLGTPEEHDEVYSRKTFEADKKSKVRQLQLKQFDTFFEYAKKECEKRGEKALEPHDSRRLCQVYEEMVLKGDKQAAWNCYAFEENLMSEEDELLDYNTIDDAAYYKEAQSTAFFEMRLFVHLAFEKQPEIISRLPALKNVKTWVVNGTGDAVCPDTYAKALVAGLEKEGVPHKAYFVDANHKASSKNIKSALQKSLGEFCEEIGGIVTMKVTANKGSGFYAKSAKAFFTGVTDKDGNEKKAVSKLRISGLGNSVNNAVAAALAVEAEGLANITRIDTSYPDLDKRPCPHICISLEKK